MIPTTLFGRTGHLSTRAIFGAAALGQVTQAEADATLDVLLAHGVNHIDTAASYGEAEVRLGPWMTTSAASINRSGSPPSGQIGAAMYSRSASRSNTSTTVGRTNIMSGTSMGFAGGRGSFSTSPIVS